MKIFNIQCAVTGVSSQTIAKICRYISYDINNSIDILIKGDRCIITNNNLKSKYLLTFRGYKRCFTMLKDTLYNK